MAICFSMKVVFPQPKPKIIFIFGCLALLGWLPLYFDPVFERYDTLLLFLLPVAFGLVVFYVPAFRSDAAVLTPRNLMLFIWLNKLVIIPVELLLVGNKALLFNTADYPLFDEIKITLLAFFAFVCGWIWSEKRVRRIENQPRLMPPVSLKWIALVYLLIGVFSLLWLYGSLQEYAEGAIFTPITREIMEQVSGALTGYLANVGQRFLPFGIMLAWCFFTQKRTFRWYENGLWLSLCLVNTLSSNRSNMIYPLLAFLSIMLVNWRVKHKWLLVLSAVGVTLLLLFFGYLRFQPNLDSESVGYLFDAYLSETDYVWYAHQIYFGTPYQITPLLHSDIPYHSTWLASLLDPVPILGKFFREQSGPTLYNLAIYGFPDVQDKVIPVAGELFYNGGYFAVTLGHLAFGWVYQRLDALFKQYALAALPLALNLFYIALLFNAVLLLSLSVLAQFFVYNAAPALLIWAVYRVKFPVLFKR